jgi:hypothetical protein
LGGCFLWAVFSITEVAQTFLVHISTEKGFFINFDEK